MNVNSRNSKLGRDYAGKLADKAKKQRNVGPMIEPWVITTLMRKDIEEWPFNMSFIIRFLKNDWIKMNIRPATL